MEHLENPSVFLREALRVLKPGGLLISLVPDWESQYMKFYDDYTHVSPFTEISLTNIQLASGFEDVDTRKFRQLPITWKYPVMDCLCKMIGLFVPVRTRFSFLRWSRELMLLSVCKKPVK